LSYFLLTALEGDNRLLGIPFATVTVTWVSTIIIMYKSITVLQSKLSEAYPWKKMRDITIISIISGAPVAGLLFFELPEIVLLFGSVIIYGLVFLIFGFKFNILEEAEINLLKSFFSLKN
jgi:hypothetical protein